MVSTGQGTETVSALVMQKSYGLWQASRFSTYPTTNKACTTLNYTVFSLQNVTLELYADGPCSTFGDTLVLS